MTTFGDLIHQHEWADVMPVLLAAYPEQFVNLDGYEAVYAVLRAMQPVATEFTILIRQCEDIDGTSYANVSGDDGTEPGPWSLEFTDWREWLGMAVQPDTLATFGPLAVLAHCLYEMTFMGWTPEDITERRRELNMAYDDAMRAETQAWDALSDEALASADRAMSDATENTPASDNVRPIEGGYCNG